MLVVVGLAGLNSGCVFVCAFVFCQPAAPLLQPPCVGSVLLHFIICFCGGLSCLSGGVDLFCVCLFGFAVEF